MLATPLWRRVPWSLYAAATLLIAGTSAIAVAQHGTGTEGLRFASRYSAWVSFPFFLVAFSASALSRLVPGPTTFGILARRRHWGLAFAWAHFLHLGIFVSYFVSLGKPPPSFLLWAGGAGYVAIALLAATSNDAAQRMLGSTWARLHTVLMYVLWLLFLLTFATALGNPERRVTGIAGAGLCLLIIGLRIVSRRGRSVAPVAAPQS